MVYSSSHIWAAYKFNDAFYYLKRQLLFGVLGLVMMLVFARLIIIGIFVIASSSLGSVFYY